VHHSKRLINGATRFQQGREQRPYEELRAPQLNVAYQRRRRCRPSAVAMVGSSLITLVAPSVDRRHRFVTDLLHSVFEQPTKQDLGITSAKAQNTWPKRASSWWIITSYLIQGLLSRFSPSLACWPTSPVNPLRYFRRPRDAKHEVSPAAGRAGYRIKEVPVPIGEREAGSPSSGIRASILMVVKAVVVTSLRVGIALSPPPRTAP